MKSEHRHELQTNDLSKLTKRGIEVVEEHALKITVVICVIAVAVAGYRIYTSQTSSALASAWTEFSASTPNAEGFGMVAANDGVKGTVVEDWALLMSAETRLPDGVQTMFSDRENGLITLRQARDDFEKLTSSSDKLIVPRALFGLARAEESLGNLEEARAAYNRLASDEFKGSIYQKPARERAEELEKSGPQAFYAWFMKQNPKPPEQPKPDRGGSPGSNPFEQEDFPFGGGGTTLPFGAGTPDLPTDLPKLDSTPSDAGDKPAADTESSTDAPAAPKSEPAAQDDAAETPSEPATDGETDGAAETSDGEK